MEQQAFVGVRVATRRRRVRPRPRRTSKPLSSVTRAIAATLILFLFTKLFVGDAFRVQLPFYGRRGAPVPSIVAPSIGSCPWTSRRSKARAQALVQKHTTMLWMGKGDGKKKRKKKKAPPTPAPSTPEPAPLRVSNNINIPVRHQIRMAQLNKQARQVGAGFRQKRVERTRYRRTWDEEEIEMKAEERRRKGQDPDWDVILSRNSSSPLVIVDGYNIIHKWPRLKKHMVKGDMQRARQLLLDDLENLRSLKGWRIEVVFDGTGRSIVGPLGQGPGGSTNRPTRLDQEARVDVSKHGVRVVFTGVGIEADSYIESRCAQAKNVTDGSATGNFIVATDDSMIRMAGQSAGALCMSADRFVNELKAVKKAVSYRVEAAVAQANGHVIRPEKLRGTQIRRFGRGSVLLEDKRNRTKTKSARQEELDLIDIAIEVEEYEDGIPWWAKVPNQTHGYRS